MIDLMAWDWCLWIFCLRYPDHCKVFLLSSFCRAVEALLECCVCNQFFPQTNFFFNVSITVVGCMVVVKWFTSFIVCTNTPPI